MRFSVVIPWRDRDVLGFTIGANIERIHAHDGEVIVVNAGGSMDTLRRLLKGHGRDIKCINLDSVTEFNRSECANVGASRSNADCLFVLDADILLVNDFIDSALHRVSSEPLFVSVRHVIESDPKTRRGETVRPGFGLLMVRASHFKAVGGFNSSLRGHGFEDVDIALRLAAALKLKWTRLGDVVHVSHPEVPLANQSTAHNRAISNDNLARGAFGGTLSDDAKRWNFSPTEIIV